jgi:hypothetical protein
LREEIVVGDGEGEVNSVQRERVYLPLTSLLSLA